MAKLEVLMGSQRVCIVYDADAAVSLRDLLATSSLPLPGACGGAGKCGCCLVTIVDGACSELSRVEKEILTTDEVRCGSRLACQTSPCGDVVCTFVDAVGE